MLNMILLKKFKNVWIKLWINMENNNDLNSKEFYIVMI